MHFKRAIGIVGLMFLLTTISSSQWSGFGGAATYGISPLPRDMVSAHMAIRSRLGLAPLVWSNRLAAYAQHWAEILITTGDFTPHRDPPYGENLYEITGGTSTPYDVVNAWASEAASYDVRRNSCSGRCGHYTQVVWRETKAVGCGVARAGRREVWVCSYDPAGNIVGERPF